MAVTLTGPLGVGGTLVTAARLYRRHLGSLTRAAAAVTVPAALASGLLRLWLLPGVALPGWDLRWLIEPSSGVGPGERWRALGAILLLTAINVVASNLVIGASFATVSAAFSGGSPAWQHGVRFAWTWLASLTWVEIVAGLVLALALLALVVPGIYLAVAWSVALPVLLSEGRRGRRALARSRQLVRGQWWPTLAVVLAAFVPVVALAALSRVSGSMLSQNTTSFAGAEAALTAINIVGGVAVQPFLVAVTTVLYFDLRSRQESRRRTLPGFGDVGPSPGAGPGGGQPAPLPAPSSDFASVPAYDAARRRGAVAGPEETSDVGDQPDPTDSGEATAVVSVPAYDPSARRGGPLSPTPSTGMATGSGMASPGATGMWAGGYEPYTTTRSRHEDVRMRTVVVGVFIGMWLFVISAYVLALASGRATLDSLPFTSTSTTSTVPGVPTVPGSTP